MSKNLGIGINSLDAFDEKDNLNVVIETPKGCRNKYKFDEQKEIFILSGVLPLGASFPFDFGFIPNTLGGDGDPLDVLILMDEPAFPGCLVPARLIGVIESEQTEDGKTERNDRLIATAENSKTHNHVKTLDDLNKNVVEQIKHFFVSYNEEKGKKFEPLGHFGPDRARKLIEQGVKDLKDKQKSKKTSKAKKK